MGCLFDAIDDDKDTYSCLCRKWGAKEDSLYSTHYYWIKKLYEAEVKKNTLKKEIKELKDKLRAKEKELKKLK